MSRATATANIFMQVAGPAANYAALPMLSRLHHAGQPVRAAIAKAAAYLTVCGWPPLVVIALFPGEVITLLYGAAWMECVPVISWLCLAAGIAMTFNFHGAGLLAIGRPYLSVLPPAALLAFRLAVVFMVYDGTLISFAQALAAAAAASVPVGLWIQLRLFGMPVREFAREIVPSVLVTLACLAAALALHAALPGTWPVALRLAVVLLAETAVWLFALIWVRHPLVAELELLGRRMAPAGRLLTGARALVGR